MNRRSTRPRLAPALALASLALLSPALRAGPEPLGTPGESGGTASEQLQLPFGTDGLISPPDASLPLLPRLGLLSVMAPFAPAQLGGLAAALSPLRPAPDMSDGSWRIAAGGLRHPQRYGARMPGRLVARLEGLLSPRDARTASPPNATAFEQFLLLFDGAAVPVESARETSPTDYEERMDFVERMTAELEPGRIFTEDALQTIARQAGIRNPPGNIGNALAGKYRVMLTHNGVYLSFGGENLDPQAASKMSEAVFHINYGQEAAGITRLASIVSANPRLKEPAALYRNACVGLLNQVLAKTFSSDARKLGISLNGIPNLHSLDALV